MEEVVLGKAYDRKLLVRLVRYARPYWPVVLVSLVFLLANALIQTAGPLLTKIAIDRYLAPTGVSEILWVDKWLSTDARAGLLQVSIVYLLCIVAGLLFDFGQQYLMQWTGQHAMFDLRREIFSKLQRADISFYDRNPVGRLVTRVTTDVDVLNELFASGLVTILGDVLVLVLIVVVMFQLSPVLTLVLLAVMPLVAVVTTVFRRTVQSSNRQIRVAVARINSFIQEHVNGIQVLQLFNREPRSREQFDTVNSDHRDAYKGAINAYGWFYPAVEFLSTLALAMLLVVGGYRVQDSALSLGVLVAFFQYGMRIFRPIQDLSEKYNILQSAMTASERIFLLLDQKPSITPPASPLEPSATVQPIEFDHVWFAYRDEDWVLRDVSFTINPGETLAVVGHSGAGKTTLTNLLLRFYDVQKGSIRIGGTDIRSIHPTRLRSMFSVVLQDPYLFTGTIGSNITLSSDGVGAKAAMEAARQVNLAPYIEGLPSKLDHPVRERGSGLSTGQKQLVSFARALAHNPDYLILDEATSSVDTETEMKVRAALENLISNRTSVVIAHRLSTIQKADRILVMHKGQLRETGTHQELLAQRGIYWKLYQLQYKDQEKVA